MASRSWTPFAIIFLGAWLLMCAATFGYIHTSLAKSEIICGLLFIILGWIARRNKHWPLGFIGLIGVWLQFAPLLLRVPNAAGYSNDTLIGLLAILFSILLYPKEEVEGNSIPKGWTYNPSSYVQRLPVAVLAGICWFLSRYLAAYQLGFIDAIWDPFFENGTVQVITSSISRSLPIPDAGLGAFAYTLEFLLCCHGGNKRWRTAPWLVLSFGLLVVPVGLVSILLIILQPLLVHAWCTVCLITAACMLLMITLTADEVSASLQLLRRRKKVTLWYVMWYGDSLEDKTSSKEVLLDAPTRKLFKAFTLGWNAPWNLILSTLLGIVVMIIPSYWALEDLMANVDHVTGALIIVISVISFAYVARKTRFALWFFVAALLIAALLKTSGIVLLAHLAIGILLALLLLKRERQSRFNS